jgi:hypothetical protein
MRTPPSSPPGPSRTPPRPRTRRGFRFAGRHTQWNLGPSAELRVWTFVPRFLSSGDWRGSKPRHGHSAGFVFRAGRQGNQDRTRSGRTDRETARISKTQQFRPSMSSPAFRSWPPLRARSSRAASRPFRRHFLGRQWLDRRAVNNAAVCVEHRSVTRAVPGALGIVPGHRTALVGAGRGKGMRLPVVILPHGELLLAVLDDAAFAGGEVRDAGNTGG